MPDTAGRQHSDIVRDWINRSWMFRPYTSPTAPEALAALDGLAADATAAQRERDEALNERALGIRDAIEGTRQANMRADAAVARSDRLENERDEARDELERERASRRARNEGRSPASAHANDGGLIEQPLVREMGVTTADLGKPIGGPPHVNDGADYDTWEMSKP